MPPEYSFEILGLGYEGMPLKISDNTRVFELKNASQIKYYVNKLKPDISVVFHSFYLVSSLIQSIEVLPGKRILYLPCIPSGELLQTNEGMKKIEEIKRKENLGLVNNRNIKKFTNDFDGELNIIKGRGLLPLKLTDEHPIFVRNRRKTIHRRKGKERFYEYVFSEAKAKKASELQIGDFLIFPKQILEECSDLSSDEVAFLGIYLAEGWARTDGEIFTSFGSHELDLISDYKKLVKRLFMKEPHEGKEGNSIKVYFAQKEVARTLRRLGKATEKQIPPEGLRMRKELIPVFFEWLRRGDGYFKDGYPTITTSSKKLALQTQKLLSRMDVFASVSRARGSGRGNIRGRSFKQNPLYQISVTSDAEKLGYLQRGKIKRPMFRNEKEFLIPVVSMKKESWKGKVLNFRTEKGTYEYGNILTHNCEGEDIPFQYRKYFQKFNTIITPSEFSRKIMKKSGIEASVVPHGVDTSFFIPKQDKWHEFRYGYLGLNDIRKQIPRVMEAFSRVKEGTLVIAANQEGHYDLVSLAKQYNISPIFIEAKLLGLTMNREAIRDFLQTLDVYIAPASESFGVPALEAQACGVPAIASSHGAAPQVLGNGALYCGISDYLESTVGKVGLISIADLYRKMRFMIQVEDARKRTAVKALENSKKWPWETAVKKMVEVLGD